MLILSHRNKMSNVKTINMK